MPAKQPLFHRMASRECDVCGQPIAPASAAGQPVKTIAHCAAAECRRVAGQAASMAPPIFARYLQSQAAAIRQRRAQAAVEARRVAELEAREAEEDQHILQRVLAAAPELKHETTLAVQIPSGHSHSVPIGADRIASYREHLQRIAAEAARVTCAADIHADTNRQARKTARAHDSMFAANPSVRRTSERLCAMCGGGCCTRGGNHAHLSPLTMRTLMDANPAMNVNAIVDAYLEKLRPHSLEGACINQSKTGCALPPAMRSDICNAYFCGSLRDYQLAAKAAPVDAVVAIQRREPLWHSHDPNAQNAVVGVSVIDESGVKQAPNAGKG